MNNEKIGKFISKLRKAKNLTQQQLGDLVGVGGKSVSKWERGINMPDISIINEVSKILGITSDELLQGEFNKNSANEEYLKKKNQLRYRLLLIILIIFTSIFTILLIFYFNDNTHKYWISGSNEDFRIDGALEYNKEEYTININEISCNLEECRDLYISNIQYSILINNVVVYMNNNDDQISDLPNINEYLYKRTIRVNDKYRNSVISYNDIVKAKQLYIIINGYDSNNNLFEYNISLEITDK